MAHIKTTKKNQSVNQNSSKNATGTAIMSPPAIQFKEKKEGEKETLTTDSKFLAPEIFSPIDPTSPPAANIPPPFTGTKTSTVQKKASKSSNIAPFQLKAKKSSGQGIPEDVRSKMENAFKADFSNVKIQTNSSSAKDLGALAYAKGEEVHFASGQFKPSTQSGQELIGHELAHILQQRAGRVKPTRSAGGVDINDDVSLEREADNMGRKAAAMKTPQVAVPQAVSAPVQGKGIVQGFFGKLWEGAKSVGSSVASGARSVGRGVASGARAVGRGVRTVGSGVASGASAVGRATGRGVRTVGRGIASGARAVGRATGRGVRAMGRGIASGAGAVGRGVRAVGRGVVSGARVVGRGASAVGRAADRGVRAVGRGIASGARAVGRNVVRGARVANGLAHAGALYTRLKWRAKGGIAASLGRSVLNSAGRIGGGIVDGVRSVGGGIVDGARSVGGGIVDGVRSVGGGIVNGVRSVGSGIANGARSVGGGIVDGARSVGSGIVDGVGSIARGDISGGLGDIGGGIVGGVRSVGGGIVNGVRSVGGGIVDGVRSVGGGIVDGVRSVGGGIVNGVRSVGSGIANGARAVGSALAGEGRRMWNGAQNAYNGVRNFVGDVKENGFLSTVEDRALGAIYGEDRRSGPQGREANLDELSEQYGIDEFMTDAAYFGPDEDREGLNDSERERLAALGYDPDTFETVEGENGLQMVYVLPSEGSDLDPYLSMRGSETDEDLANDWGTDFDYQEVGRTQYDNNEDQINALMDYLTEQSGSGRIQLSGHSLGGALAQRLTAERPEAVSRLTGFQTPGVSEDTYNTHMRNVSQLEDGVAAPEIAYHYSQNDIVHLAGERNLPGTHFVHDSARWSDSSTPIPHTETLLDNENSQSPTPGHGVTQYDEYPFPHAREFAEDNRKRYGVHLQGILDGIAAYRND